ncbi:MAG: sigma-70 family RNA polymerase sigma factor [Chloroflexi bacterium]|nr:sigma-70 family RNA polymerase sigma factor [Chloroflexota bacterium]
MITKDSEEKLAQINELVIQAQSGDRVAFASLYDHFYDRIYRYVMFKTSNSSEAEDLAEGVFLRMLEAIHTYKHQGVPFAAWLFRIAHNLVIDHHRKRSRERLTPLDSAAQIADKSHQGLDERLDVGLAMVHVNQAMEGLTDLQREAITLRFAGGLSVQETARAMGKKENAVKALQHAGINKLRRILTAAARPVEQYAAW